VQDFIGAARPSIADPFLPAKIREGREDEIRECIGCNICRAANNEGVGLRCTQNPTMGEEWRRGWHPERIAVHPRRETALVIGGGPAGLEAALTLGRRGLEVTLAEAGDAFGGRLLREATLPGLATWMRVRDWRLTMLDKLPNVQLYPGSRMGAAEVAEFGADHVVLATGSRWRRDGVGVYAIRHGVFPEALTPDDVFAGARVTGSVVIYDDEHYFMAGALAERLAKQGHAVRYVTTAALASSWTVLTNEQDFLQARLIGAGVEIIPLKSLTSQGKGEVALSCVYTGREERLPCGTLILATGRLPEDSLWHDLVAAGITATRIGDCLAPSSIADAVHSAHRFARLLGEPDLPPRRERAPERSL
jgi:dimethylamine/trimethylamine dehydrogenase